ncbi:MAG: dephospho-CoA kinase [Bacteroidota bacterium]
MMIVGLTGGIGSGKSTVAKMFRDLSIPVYDSDKEAKALMNSSERLKKALIGLLGVSAYREGALDRSFVARQVFGNDQLLQKLNKIVHPAVREHFLRWAKEQQSRYVIQESALIFENGMEDFYDNIILVTAPIELRVDRVIKRDNSEKSAILKRIKHQMDDQVKKDKAHFLIENIHLETTRDQVSRIHTQLLKLVG